MNMNKKSPGWQTAILLSRMLALSLVLLLILQTVTGCSLPAKTQSSAELTSDASTPQEDYEIYHKDDLQTRKKFEELCRQFMIDQLSDSFLNLHYTLLDPEAYGITNYEKTFGSFNLEDILRARQKQKAFQTSFESLNPELLDKNQQLTYRILMAAFKAEEAGDGLELYSQPLAPATGIQAQLPILLGEFTFHDRQDIDDYLILLSNIDEFYQQILDFEKEKSNAGLFMSDDCAEQITEECSGYLLPADHNFMTSSFNQRIDSMDGLSDQEKENYKARNQSIVSESFIPAYEHLTNGLNELKGTCTNEQGLCYYPDGKDYYEYLVRSSIGTTYETMEELRDAIAEQINDDLLAMSQILKEFPDTAEQLTEQPFSPMEPGEILENLKNLIGRDFPEIPECRYTTKYVPEELSSALGPAFFLVPPIDDYDECIIYINPASTSDSQPLYTTLAHEGIPGHMYQNVYFLSQCTNNLRKILSFTSYSEGWATYVEYYAYTAGCELSPELGQLLAHNASASLGLHALIDININYFGWTRQQVKEFLEPYFDFSQEESDDLLSAIYNTMLYSPVNYLNYYVGYLEIIKMKNQAQETLGNRFNLKEFHKFLLDVGPAPFTVINEEFHSWLTACQSA